MVEIIPALSEEISFENLNSNDLEAKVKDQPLTLTLIIFYVLA